ncbi:DUF1003 domain-containing protein [Parenemella sanctibonifatiensis]|uniref:DUF1003 domain-containing protein n=1 Tax=Parenemella sanctibonifatiensis TaxID=2016505 RepID=A0A255EDH6_9ACTN|nr:DUF1003 domain-containing protein [Parenemella sanctibonifatiensis]OYN89589.1 hypothetical protein CGZ92_02380 [Parenemella sanctibonifatiensis]OYN89743.1 hypothetical protein CGZ91_09475 [Parenemella sanctibonifatiensis]
MPVDHDALSTPGRRQPSLLPRVSVDGDAFGAFAESFARFMGTARFLLWMTVFIVVWVSWNTLLPEAVRFDEYPFIFLTFALSLQASYSAPLILLAQNRQEARDRISAEADRAQARQSRADTDFLARELASVRFNIGELATRDYIRSEMRGDMADELADAVAEKVLARLRDADAR